MTRHHLSDDRAPRRLHFDRRGGDVQRAPAPLCATCQERATRASRDAARRREPGRGRARPTRVFRPERLARQQARILERIAHEGRPARVISFPAAPHAAGAPARARHALGGGRRGRGPRPRHRRPGMSRTASRARRIRRASFQAPAAQVAAQPVRAVDRAGRSRPPTTSSSARSSSRSAAPDRRPCGRSTR